MIVKAYYDNGHFDVFDTLTLVDPSLFPKNALTNYSIEMSDVRNKDSPLAEHLLLRSGWLV